eukprot:gene1521-12647_t
MKWCMETIPDEMIMEIIEFLPEEELIQVVSLINRKWFFYSSIEKNWLKRCETQSQLSPQNVQNLIKLQEKNLDIYTNNKCLQLKKLFQKLYPVTESYHFSTKFNAIKINDSTSFTAIYDIESDRLVKTVQPIHSKCDIFYFEVSIVDSPAGNINSVGLVHKKYPLKRQPGWQKGSVGYHGDDGNFFIESAFGNNRHERFGKNDVIGCGYWKPKSKVFFTKNGEFMGIACESEIDDLYPCVGLWRSCKIKANFGNKDFQFDLSKLSLEKLEEEVEYLLEQEDEEMEEETQLNLFRLNELLGEFDQISNDQQVNEFLQGMQHYLDQE